MIFTTAHRQRHSIGNSLFFLGIILLWIGGGGNGFSLQAQSLKYYHKLFLKGDSAKALQKVHQASKEYPKEPTLGFWLLKEAYKELLYTNQGFIEKADSLTKFSEEQQINYLALSPAERIEREEFGLFSESFEQFKTKLDSLAFSKAVQSKESLRHLENYVSKSFSLQKNKAQTLIASLQFEKLNKSSENQLALFAQQFKGFPEAVKALAIIDSLQFQKAMEGNTKKSYLITKENAPIHFKERIAKAYWDSLFSSFSSPTDWVKEWPVFNKVSEAWGNKLISSSYAFCNTTALQDSFLISNYQLPGKERLRLLSEPLFLLKDTALANQWQMVNNLGLVRFAFSFDTATLSQEQKKQFFLGRLLPTAMLHLEGTHLLYSKYMNGEKHIEKNSLLPISEDDAYLKHFVLLADYNTPLNSKSASYQYHLIGPTFDTLITYAFAKPIQQLSSLSSNVFLIKYADSSFQLIHRAGAPLTENFSYPTEIISDSPKNALQISVLETPETDSTIILPIENLDAVISQEMHKKPSTLPFTIEKLYALLTHSLMDSTNFLMRDSTTKQYPFTKEVALNEILNQYELRIKKNIDKQKKSIIYQLLTKEGKAIISNFNAYNKDEFGNIVLLKDNKFGLYNPEKKLLIEPIYTAIPKAYGFETEGIYIVKQKEGFGLYAAKEKRLVSNSFYKQLHDWNRLNMIAETDSGKQFLSLMSFTVSNTVFKNSQIKSYKMEDGSSLQLMIIRSKGKASLISSKTGTVLEPIFEDISIRQLPNKQLLYITSNELEGNKTMLSFYNQRGSLLFSRIYASGVLDLE